MHHFTYNKTQRQKILNPKIILQQAGLKEGMTVIDLGCNDGYFTIPAARIVGKTGRILGVDIDQQALLKLQKSAGHNSLPNIYTANAPAEDYLPNENFADLILLSTVLHDFNDAQKVLKNAFKMLKPSAKLINIDWKKEYSNFGPPLEKRFSVDKTKNLLEQAGFSITSSDEINKLFYRLVGVKAETTSNIKFS